MKSVNYITNTPLTEISGGGSGVNNAVVRQLSKTFSLNYVGPINPPASKLLHLVSKTRRMAGLQGGYHFFSNRRLKTIARLVEEEIEKSPADCNFFHHFTSWVLVKNAVPYFGYTDACFATYVEIFNRREEFLKKDLDRIYRQEAAFMDNACKVFFRSQWALDETKKAYNLSGENFRVVRFGGGFEGVPQHDQYGGKLKLLFISKEFIPKGGPVVLKAFVKFHETYPDAELVIIGDQPTESIKHPKIHFEGFLDKATTDGEACFCKHLEEAFLLIHPTTKDTNTLVIVEAAYFGCPSIASSSFAIPEFIENGKTGFLIEDVEDEDEIIEKLKIVAENQILYQKMRKNVRTKALEDFTWDKVGDLIGRDMEKGLSG